MSPVRRHPSVAIRRTLCAICLACFVPGSLSGDSFREPFCLGFHADDPGASDGGRTMVKVIRWPYAIELPFHILPPDRIADDGALDSTVRVIFQGHGGLVMQGPRDKPWNAEFELTAAFPRGPDPATPLCASDTGLIVPSARLVTDPYTGNVSVGRFRETELDLVVIDSQGEMLARIRSDIYFGAPIQDRSGTSADSLADEPGDYFWFDADRLAGFVDVYRRLGQANYARFIVDAFLAQTAHAGRTADDVDTGPRLPYLPVRDDDDARFAVEELDNLRGLRTTYRQVFVSDKPRKGGVSCALMPVLKMIEDRDCRGSAEDVRGPAQQAGACPAYSAMALQTELFRTHPETLNDRSYAFYEVFERLIDKGVCAEGYYPMLRDIAIGFPKSLESLAKRSERELNRILKSRTTAAPEEFREFLELTAGDDVSFVDQLPALCQREMQRYREHHTLAPHDLVDLFTVQKQFAGALPEALSSRLVEAHKAELFSLLVRLLRRGLLVGVSGDAGLLDGHAELAYGWTRDGFLLMDSDANDERTRRRTVISAGELRRVLAGVAFLRGQVEAEEPTEAQLVRSAGIAPDLPWIPRRLGEICAAEGRHREAVAHLRRAAELAPQRARTWLALAESLQAFGQFEPALQAARRAIAAGADETDASALIGYSLRKLGRLKEAEHALRESLSPEHAWGWRQLGWTLYDLGRDDEAERCLRRAVELGPQRVWNHVSLAELLAYRGKQAQARELLLAASQRDFDTDAEVWIAGTLGWLGDTDAAETQLRAVLDAEPENGSAALALARIYRRTGDDDAVARVLGPLERRLSRRLDGGAADNASVIELAYAHALAGRGDACLETVKRLDERRGSLEGGELYELACIHALNGDTDRALEQLAAAFERGFDDYRWARNDPDLAALAADPRLEQIFFRYGRHER